MSGQSLWRSQGRSLDDKGWAPLRYWALWWVGIGLAVTAFYVILTPLWMGLRALAWLAELRARRRR